MPDSLAGRPDAEQHASLLSAAVRDAITSAVELFPDDGSLTKADRGRLIKAREARLDSIERRKDAALTNARRRSDQAFFLALSGLVFGAVVSLVIVLAALEIISSGTPDAKWAATIVGGLDLVALVATFVYGSRGIRVAHVNRDASRETARPEDDKKTD